MNSMLERDSLIIAGVGDSQMWGEGADGWKEAMPDCRPGELRRLAPTVPSFMTKLDAEMKARRGQGRPAIVYNCAVGSTSVRQYIQRYWDGWVKSRRPDLIIMMSSINDWLQQLPLGVYRDCLKAMLEDSRGWGAEALMMTQGPIRGSQISGVCVYDDYIDAFREVAQSSGAMLADANDVMKRMLMSEERAMDDLYYDDWHVSQRGHDIYLRCIWDALR